MKFLKLALAITICLTVIFSACKKADVYTDRISYGSLVDSSGECLPKTVEGIYGADTALTELNFIDIHVIVDSVGAYEIKTDSINGYSFTGVGTFGKIGDNRVRLYGHGKPSFGGTNIFTLVYGNTSCQVAIKVNGSALVPAVYTLDTLGGECSGASTSGTLYATIATTSSNKAELGIVVTTKGSYNITATSIPNNGLTYSASGIFTTTGAQKLVLDAHGTPTNAGKFNYNVQIGATSCTYSVEVAAAPATAVFTLGGSPSACTGFVLGGTYIVGTSLTAGNIVSLEVNVATIGAYSISTNTVNGMTFSKSGVFTSLGTQTVILQGTGTPASATTSAFTALANGNGCSFSITTSPASSGGGAAVFTLGGAPGTCTGGSTAGTFTVGTALTNANTLSIQVNVATIGSYLISTNLANGISFSKTGSFTSTGAQTIVLTGTGTPNAAGTKNYTITAGSNTCTLNVVINSGSGTSLNGVYVAGFEYVGVYKNAKMWKDGVMSTLANGAVNGVAYSVCGSGSDVYMAGFTANTLGQRIATIWKNGVPTYLTDPMVSVAEAYSVFVVGSDVYAAGYDDTYGGGNQIATVWKNGVATSLSDGTTIAEALSVFVSGTDVYIAGNLGGAATLWKNGVAATLTGSGTTAKSVAVSGTNVYVAGISGGVATLWKNGTATTLVNGATAYSVFISGSDVYVAGIVNSNDAGYWKNGILTSLTTGFTKASAQTIFVSGSDVYVAGTGGTDDTNTATLWKNGIATRLTGVPGIFYQVSNAYGIYVK